jgi:hypothetical protein
MLELSEGNRDLAIKAIMKLGLVHSKHHGFIKEEDGIEIRHNSEADSVL